MLKYSLIFHKGRKMSQSKSPKKTTQKILDISLNLFSIYGFESVKMQDIVNKLASFGLSKGAIYHHFKNKEDILEAILARYEEGADALWDIQHSQNNGRNKIQAIILQHLEHIAKHKTLIRDCGAIFSSPRAIAHRLHHNNICPILESFIEEGNADGSLNVAYPKSASEMLFWAVYVWLDNMFYPLSQMQYTHKVRHLRIMCEGVGLSVIDEEFSTKALQVWKEIVA